MVLDFLFFNKSLALAKYLYNSHYSDIVFLCQEVIKNFNFPKQIGTPANTSRDAKNKEKL